MADEKVTIDFIVRDEEARAKITNLMADLGTNAKMVRQPIDGWSEGASKFASQMQTMILGGGVLYEARKIAMQIKDAIESVNVSRQTNLSFQENVSGLLSENIVNALPIYMPDGTTRQRSKDQLLAGIKGMMGRAGGGNLLDALDWVPKAMGAASGTPEPQFWEMADQMQRFFIRTKAPKERMVGYATAATEVMQTAGSFGFNAEQALGYLEAARNASLVGDPMEFTTSFVPIARTMAGIGATPQDIFYLNTLMSHATGDVHGHIAATATSGLYRSLVSGPFGPGGKAFEKGTPADEMIKGMQAYFRNLSDKAGGGQQGLAAIIRAVPRLIKGGRGGNTTMAYAALAAGDFSLSQEQMAEAFGAYGVSPGDVIPGAAMATGKKLSALAMVNVDLVSRMRSLSPEAQAEFWRLPFGAEGESEPGQQANLAEAKITQITQFRQLQQSAKDSAKARVNKMREGVFEAATGISLGRKTYAQWLMNTEIAMGRDPDKSYRDLMRHEAAISRGGLGGWVARQADPLEGLSILGIVPKVQRFYAEDDAREKDAAMFDEARKASAKQFPPPKRSIYQKIESAGTAAAGFSRITSPAFLAIDSMWKLTQHLGNAARALLSAESAVGSSNSQSADQVASPNGP